MSMRSTLEELPCSLQVPVAPVGENLIMLHQYCNNLKKKIKCQNKLGGKKRYLGSALALPLLTAPILLPGQ